MGKFIVHLDSGDEADPSRLGVKCASLVSLTGVPGLARIPSGFAVTTDAFAAVLAEGGLRTWAERTTRRVDPNDVTMADRASIAIRRAIMAQPMPAGMVSEVRAAYLALEAKHGVGVPVAVRSSALAEDLPDASFAGLHDTVLWVVGADAVLDAIRRCWASLFTARAIIYRACNPVPAERVSMAVAVQKMVRSRVSGVAMTLDPGNGDRSKIVIDASWGIGALIGSGEVTPDNYVVDKVTLVTVRTTVSDKSEELVADPSDTTMIRRPVDEERRSQPCLRAEEVVSLAQLAKTAERHYGTPQEVEWAIEPSLPGSDGDSHDVVLLQCRPETIWRHRTRETPAYSPEAGAVAIARTLLGSPPPGTPPVVDAPAAPQRPAAAPGDRLPHSPAVSGASTPGFPDRRDGEDGEDGRRNSPDTRRRTRFPSPYELAAPHGAEGWQRLYAYYEVFQPDRREREENTFWFCDTQHWPKVLRPFEAIVPAFAFRCIRQYNNRYFLVPPASGMDYRIHNGYVYVTPVAVPPEEISARVPEFLRRADHYYANWEELLKGWKQRVLDTIAEMEKLDFSPLPDAAPLTAVESGLGPDAVRRISDDYDRLIQLCDRGWHHHMEFLQLGYAAYLDFFEFCKGQFPGIPDQGIATMLQGADIELFHPDDQLKSLAKLALRLGVADALRSCDDVEQRFAAVANTARGHEWLRAWEDAKQPWFNFTSGNGHYGSDEYWLDHPSIPLDYIVGYIGRLERGEDIDRHLDDLLAERDRVTSEYRELLAPGPTQAFTAKVELARRVYPYVENHNFYIEHWTMSVFWRKVRDLSRLLQEAGFWSDPDDLFYLGRDEVRQVLFDYLYSWAAGTPPVGTTYWPGEVSHRRAVVEALAAVRPEPALNEPPQVITEPFTVMLWGITPERITAWLGPPEDTGGLTGMAASAGVVEGPARVLTGVGELGAVQEGDILVAPVASPSWGPVFGKIGGVVTDIGGMMSHAAVACREYSLPAVTGTGTASVLLRNGQRVRVDGSRGIVRILDSPEPV